jgi:hypothetical protein
MEHKREMRLMLSWTGVLVVGVTSVTRGSEGESERDPVVNVFVSPLPLRPPPRQPPPS